MRQRVGNPSPALLVSALALFVSLGGISYAAAVGRITSRDIANNSVQSRDVRDGGLQGRDVANGSVQGRDLRNGTVTGKDVADNSLAGSDLAVNSIGDREVDETQLDLNRLGGVPAIRYVKNVLRVQTESANDATPVKGAPPAHCPKGKRIVGGGARVEAAAPAPVALNANGPSGDAWAASAYATAATGNWRLVAVAICG